MVQYYSFKEESTRMLQVLLIIVSILLIAIVLLQAGKAESASNVITGGSDALFANRKERGGELFITRLTMVLGLAFFIICLIKILSNIRRFLCLAKAHSF